MSSPEIFLGVLVHISTVYLSRTEGSSTIVLNAIIKMRRKKWDAHTFDYSTFFRCRKFIIFSGMSLFSIWKLYQSKEKSWLIVVVSLISWIVLGIIRKSEKIE